MDYRLICLHPRSQENHILGVPPLLLESTNVVSHLWRLLVHPNWSMLEEHSVDMKKGRFLFDYTYSKLQLNSILNNGAFLHSLLVVRTVLVSILMPPHLHTLMPSRTFTTYKAAPGRSALIWGGTTYQCLINTAISRTMFFHLILPNTRLQCILLLLWSLLTLVNTTLRSRLFAAMRDCLTLPLATGWVMMATWCLRSGEDGAPIPHWNGWSLTGFGWCLRTFWKSWFECVVNRTSLSPPAGLGSRFASLRHMSLVIRLLTLVSDRNASNLAFFGVWATVCNGGTRAIDVCPLPQKSLCLQVVCLVGCWSVFLIILTSLVICSLFAFCVVLRFTVTIFVLFTVLPALLTAAQRGTQLPLLNWCYGTTSRTLS